MKMIMITDLMALCFENDSVTQYRTCWSTFCIIMKKNGRTCSAIAR